MYFGYVSSLRRTQKRLSMDTKRTIGVLTSSGLKLSTLMRLGFRSIREHSLSPLFGRNLRHRDFYEDKSDSCRKRRDPASIQSGSDLVSDLVSRESVLPSPQIPLGWPKSRDDKAVVLGLNPCMPQASLPGRGSCHLFSWIL